MHIISQIHDKVNHKIEGGITLYYVVHSNDYLMHHGILGQKWGIRRYQNEDGSLTPAGVKRYQTNKKFRKRIDAEIAAKEAKRKLDMSNMSDQELQNAVNRMRLEDQYTQMMQARIPKIPPSKMDKIKEYTKAALAKTGNALVDNLSRNIGQGTAKWISDSIFGTGNNNKKGEKGDGVSSEQKARLTEEQIRKLKMENDAKERQIKADKKKLKEEKKQKKKDKKSVFGNKSADDFDDLRDVEEMNEYNFRRKRYEDSLSRGGGEYRNRYNKKQTNGGFGGFLGTSKNFDSASSSSSSRSSSFDYPDVSAFKSSTKSFFGSGSAKKAAKTSYELGRKIYEGTVIGEGTSRNNKPFSRTGPTIDVTNYRSSTKYSAPSLGALGSTPIAGFLPENSPQQKYKLTW